MKYAKYNICGDSWTISVQTPDAESKLLCASVDTQILEIFILQSVQSSSLDITKIFTSQ